MAIQSEYPPRQHGQAFPAELPLRTQPPLTAQKPAGRHGRSGFAFTLSAWSLKAKGAVLSRRISMWLLILVQFAVAVLELIFLSSDSYTFYNEADGLPYFSARLYSRYVATLAVGSIVVVLTMTTGFWIVAKVGEARGSVKMLGMTIVCHVGPTLS